MADKKKWNAKPYYLIYLEHCVRQQVLKDDSEKSNTKI